MLITNCTYHRNGSFGAGYYSLRLKWRADGRQYRGTAIVFDASEHIAVFSDTGEHFRAEDFESELRTFIESPAGQRMAFPHSAEHKIVEGLKEAVAGHAARVTIYHVKSEA